MITYDYMYVLHNILNVWTYIYSAYVYLSFLALCHITIWLHNDTTLVNDINLLHMRTEG